MSPAEAATPPASIADSWSTKTLLRKADHLRRTSKVILTCPASRHTLMIGRGLVSKRGYSMLKGETEHCVGSILATVLNLWEARAQIATLRARVEVAEAASEAAVSKAQWQAVTNAELNELIATNDALRARCEAAEKLLRGIVSTFGKTGDIPLAAIDAHLKGAGRE